MVRATTPEQKRRLAQYLTQYDSNTLDFLKLMSAHFGKAQLVDYVPHNREAQQQAQQFMRIPHATN